MFALRTIGGTVRGPLAARCLRRLGRGRTDYLAIKRAKAMPTWLNVDWQQLFVPSQPVLETIIRGSATYLALFVLLRLFRRQTGSLGPADLLVLLLIADASQNAMAGEYRAITDGLILVATIVAWEYILDWLSFYVPPLGKLIDRQPLTVIEDGKFNHEHLKRELMS